MTVSLDLIGIVTTDLVRSLAFYRVLGVETPEADGTEPHVEAVLPNGLRLAWDTLDTIRSFDPGFSPASGGHPVALAFATASPADVDALYQEVVAAGFHGHREPWDAVWGQRYAVVHDPDGNTVDLFAPLPGRP
ncbi:VOC family protein [Nocardia jinanensis]|uniref:Glyoxalase n=1 Tax=Nocardia jinanensis TaxID=382504 RepID=A0A917R9M2_9NOCA|nr:VOC family protein [Nocardia jinanensis]GGK97089.1 glyoxalase [Nocardia jinanensis]